MRSLSRRRVSQTETRKAITLTVGAQQVFDLTLHVGSAAGTVVEVTIEAPAVQRAVTI